MRAPFLFLLVAVGVALGLWHLWLAAGAIFVFREGEPFWSWLFILSGPGATLVCVIIAALRQTAGGYLLIALAVASTLVLAVATRNASDVMLADLWRIGLPMAALGLAFVFAGKQFPRVPPVSSSVSNGA
jgi:hypothetical protein